MDRCYFTADDFGSSADANRAIIRAYEDGALHGASLMMGQPGTEEAVQLARKYPELEIGLHLHFCDSTPLSCERWPWGNSSVRAAAALLVSRNARELMALELEAQWVAFKRTGLRCAFINTHHHLHLHPHVFSLMTMLADEAPVAWLRLGRPRYFRSGPIQSVMGLGGSWWSGRLRERSPWPVSDGLWGADRYERMDSGEIVAAMRLPEPGLQEFVFHPRHLEDRDTDCLVTLRRCLGKL